MNERVVREAIVFSGEVQGVGFRYRISHLADMYRVTGWVRNEYDGTVSAELQGLPEDLDKIVQGLSQDRYIQLYDIQRKTQPIIEEERGFHVRY